MCRLAEATTSQQLNQLHESSMKLIKQEYRFSDEFSAGILTVNKETLSEFNLMRQQSRRTTTSNTRSIAVSIEEIGYDLGKPLVLSSRYRTTDGYSRVSAIIELIQSNRIKSIDVSFLVTDSDPQAFNDTRGLSINDIKNIFSRTKAGGIQAGSCERAAEQARDASKMLSCSEVSFKVAHASDRTQEHLVKVDQFCEQFSEAFDGVLRVLDGKPPSEYKFAHWLALFARHGVTATGINLCRNSIITNQESSTQKSRYDAFIDLEEKFTLTRAL